MIDINTGLVGRIACQLVIARNGRRRELRPPPHALYAYPTITQLAVNRPLRLARDVKRERVPMHPDRSHEFVPALVARPGVTNAAVMIECGLIRYQDY
jgi:hypothetical protein